MTDATLAATLAKCQADLAEADRRAGAAERLLAYAKDASEARNNWLRKAKQDWGADTNVSFDVVWDEALTLKEKLAKAEADKEAQRAEFTRVIQFAITQGLEADTFLRCWLHGQWDACREYGFEPNIE